MKVLVVCRYHGGKPAPFVAEQVDAVAQAARRERGVLEMKMMDSSGGYWRFAKRLRKVIRTWHPDVVHAHYGLTGFFSCVGRLLSCSTGKPRIVVTYHGSDVNEGKTRWLCRLTSRMATWNVYVSETLKAKGCVGGKGTVIACGVDTNVMRYREKPEGEKGACVLFAGAFDNEVKNAKLAQAAVARLMEHGGGKEVSLRELKGMTREEVADALAECDALLMTSRSEGSPQVIKEAIACGTPIVSVDVGDVAERCKDVKNAIVVKRGVNGDDEELAECLASALERVMKMGHEKDGVETLRRQGLTNDVIGEKILRIMKKEEF